MENEKITPNEGEVKTAEEAQTAIDEGNDVIVGDEAEADATTSSDDESETVDESKEEYMVEPTEDAEDSEEDTTE